MKSRIFATAMALFILTATLTAQNRFAVGLIGTQFGNTANSSKLTELNHPMGYGAVASYALSKEISIAFTGEYFKGDFDSKDGNERDLRAHAAVVLTPLSTEIVRPYISAGIVYTNRNMEYSVKGISETKNIFNARFSLGADYRLIQNLSINADLGLYNDGMNIVGWSSSIGLRYGLNIF